MALIGLGCVCKSPGRRVPVHSNSAARQLCPASVTCLTALVHRPTVASTPRQEPTRRKPGPQSHGSSPPPRRRPARQPLTPRRTSATAELPKGALRSLCSCPTSSAVWQSGPTSTAPDLSSGSLRAPRPLFIRALEGAPRGNTSGVALLRAPRRPMHAPVAHHH